VGLIKRTFLEARPTEVGKIKIGQRGKAYKDSGGGTSYIPEKLDHFIVTTMDRDGKEGAFLRDAAIHAAVGAEPRQLYGTLMFPEIEENLHTEMCVYKGRRRQSSCDGETRVGRQGERDPCQSPNCPCKPYGRLHLQLDAAPHIGGYYVFRTHGWSSTNNLQTALEEIHREFGTLYRAPVRLFMQKTEDNYTDANKKEHTGRSWKVGIVLNMSVQDARAYLAAQARDAIGTRHQLRIEAGAVIADLDTEDRETEGELADEFHPPKGVEASIGTRQKLDRALEKIQGPSEPTNEPPVVEGDYVIEEGTAPVPEAAGEAAGAPEPPAVAPAPPAPPQKAPAKKHELAELLRVATKAGLLSKDQIARCDEAIASGDDSTMNITADWLRSRLKKPARGRRK
jgi:hypothetical protein